MADLVEKTLAQIRARLRELEPVVSEYERLELADAALAGSGDRGAGAHHPPSVGMSHSRRGAGADRGPGGSQGSKVRAKRGQNKAAVLGVIAERPGVTVSEIAAVTGIGKPLVYNTTRTGVERGELERIGLPGGQSGFRTLQRTGSTQPATSSG